MDEIWRRARSRDHRHRHSAQPGGGREGVGWVSAAWWSDSEVRIMLPHPRLRTSESEDHWQLCNSSGPIPKFVSYRGTLVYELRNLRTTSNSIILVPLLNPKFAIAFAARCARTSGSGH